MLLHEKKKKKELKNRVLSNAKNLYNELYYIYKGKYNKEINSLDTKNKEKLDHKKKVLVIISTCLKKNKKKNKNQQKMT